MIGYIPTVVWYITKENGSKLIKLFFRKHLAQEYVDEHPGTKWNRKEVDWTWK